MKKVYAKKCNSYDVKEIKEVFDKIFNKENKITNYIKRDSKVLVKMNLLMKRNPSEVTTTNPAVLEALLLILKDLNCKVIVADSPGGIYNEKVLKELYEICGVKTVVDKFDFARLNYDTRSFKKTSKNAKIVKSIECIYLCKEVDHIISLCKLKTHAMAVFTGGVKNMFGVIPGLLKAEYHFKMPKIKDFTNLLVDIYEIIKPSLVIMDAIEAMEGEGPSAGSKKNVNLILASSCGHSLDVKACEIVNINPFKVPTIKRALERNLLDHNLKEIKFIGENLEDIKILDFKQANIRSFDFFENYIPKSINKFISNFLKPKPFIIREKCVKCKECIKVCPTKTIDYKNKRININLDNCIRCFCCHELCPIKAIGIKKSILSKFIK